MQATRVCFVTVGTTSFDKLIKVLNDQAVRDALVNKLGVRELRIQYGRGSVKPVTLESEKLNVTAFDFKPMLTEEMEAADLIISHAGAGSIMEALRLGKPAIVVVNDELMNNHQIELASALAKGGYLAFAASPNDFRTLMLEDDIKVDDFKEYPPRDDNAFASMLDAEMGFA